MPWRILENRGFLAALWMAVLLLAVYRCFEPIHYDSHQPAPMTEEAVRLGHSLYQNGTLANPYQTLDTGPSAHTAPGFPVLAAGVYALFGDGPQGFYALKMIEAVALVMHIALLPLLMRALGTSLLTGLLAAFLTVLGVRRVPTWEANYVALLLVLATLFAALYLRAIWKKGGQPGFLGSPQAIAWVLGFIWAAILLTGPSSGAVWLVWLMLGGWLSWRRGFRYAWLPVLIVPVLAAVPWTLRNYRVFHAFVPIRDSLGLELYISNNPCAKVTLYENRHGNKCYAHPNEDAAEARKVLASGEVAYNRQKEQEALRWIAANPGTAIGLWVRRIWAFWFPVAGRQIATWTIDVVTPLSLLGLWVLFRQNQWAAILLASLAGIFPLPYYLIQASDRYRYPILWVTFALGAVALSAMVRGIFERVAAREAVYPTRGQYSRSLHR